MSNLRARLDELKKTGIEGKTKKEQEPIRNAEKLRRMLEAQMGLRPNGSVQPSRPEPTSQELTTEELVLEELGAFCDIPFRRMVTLFATRRDGALQIKVDKLAVFLVNLAFTDQQGMSTAVLDAHAKNITPRGYILDEVNGVKRKHIPELSLEDQSEIVLQLITLLDDYMPGAILTLLKHLSEQLFGNLLVEALVPLVRE